jgi:hypothetical protein
VGLGDGVQPLNPKGDRRDVAMLGLKLRFHNFIDHEARAGQDIGWYFDIGYEGRLGHRGCSAHRQGLGRHWGAASGDRIGGLHPQYWGTHRAWLRKGKLHPQRCRIGWRWDTVGIWRYWCIVLGWDGSKERNEVMNGLGLRVCSWSEWRLGRWMFQGMKNVLKAAQNDISRGTSGQFDFG